MYLPGVLSTIQQIISWILVYEDGGFLNVVFTPEVNENGTTFDIEIDTDTLMAFIKSVALGIGEMPLKVLEAMPESLGGGSAGVKQALATPNREQFFFGVPIGCIVVMILGVLLISVITCTCCLCCKCGKSDKPSKENQKDSNNAKASQKNKAPLLSMLKKKVKEIPLEKNKQNHLWCSLHIIVVILTIVYVSGLLVSLGFYFSAGELIAVTLGIYNETELELWIEGKTEDFSLVNSIQFLLRTAFGFVHEGVSSAENGTTSAISSIDAEIPKSLNASLDQLIVEMMKLFLLTNLRQQTQLAINDTITLKANMQSAITLKLSTAPTIVQLKAVSEEFRIVCTGACAAAVGADSFKFVQGLVDMENVNPVALVAVTQMIVPLTLIKEKVDEALIKIKDMQSDVFEKVSANLNITGNLGSIRDIWVQVDKEINSLQEKIEPSVDSLAEKLASLSPYIRPAIYVPVAIFLVIVVIVVVCLILFLYEAFKRHLFSAKGTHAEEEAKEHPNKIGTRVCGSLRFFIFSLYMLFVILTISSLATIILVLASFLSGEVCPYVTRISGLNKSDFVLNGFLAKRWPEIQGSLLPTENTSLPNGTLNIQQPEDVLYAIAYRCNPEHNLMNMGLLYQLGLTDVVNISAVLESDIVKDGLREGKVSVIKSISDAQLGQIIPDVTGQLDAAIKLIQGVLPVDKFKLAVKALAGIDQDIKKMKEVKVALESRPEATIPPYIPKLQKSIETMTAKVPEFMKLKNAYDGIETEFPAIKAMMETIAKFKAIVATEASITKEFSPVFDDFSKVLTTEIGNKSQEILTNLTERIFPCAKLNSVSEVFARMSCDRAGLVPRFFAWGLVLSVVTLFSFLSFVSLFMLWFIQSHQAKRFTKGLQ